MFYNNIITDDNTMLPDDEVEKAILRELKRIIANEFEKLEHEQDAELINECFKTISEMTGIKVKYTDEEIGHNLNEIKLKTNEIIMVKKAKRLYKIRLAICILVISLFTTQLIAMAFDYNPIVEIYKIITFSTDVNDITENNITYAYAGYNTEYNSINDLIKNENIDIIYPKNLPEGIKIVAIHKNEIDGYEYINVIFDSEDVLFMINEKHMINMNNVSDYEKYIIQDIEIYILDKTQEYEAIFYYKGYEYNITSPNYELLIEIINNLNISK